MVFDRRLILFFGILFFVASTSLVEASFEMSFGSDREEMTLGDELTITVEVLHSEDVRLLPLDSKFRFDPFELKRIVSLPPRTQKGLIKEGYQVVLTIFELGEFRVPPFPVPFVGSNGQLLQAMTQELPVTVISIGRTEKDIDDIRPIKVPIELIGGLTFKRFAFWFGLIVFILLAGILGFLYYAKRKSKVDPESLLSPYERTLLYLSRLEKKGYLQTGQTYLFFTDLSMILERYMIEQLRLGSEELTTEEMMTVVRGSSLSLNIQGKLQQVLDLSDLAKFAKWNPPQSESEEALSMVRGIVHETMPRESRPNSMEKNSLDSPAPGVKT